MKICPKCEMEHNKKGTFCSHSCANSRTFTKETLQKKSQAAKNHWQNLPDDKKKQKMSGLSKLHSEHYKPNYIKKLLEAPWEEITYYRAKRLRVILEQQGKCNKCSITHWNGEHITLEYEHKDGNNQNDSRENVEALCPNCHSQTSTWRGKNGNVLQKKVETYLKVLESL